MANGQRPRRAPVRESTDPLALWERELLGMAEPRGQRPHRQTRAERRSDELRVSRAYGRSRGLNRPGRKPKTAADASYRKQAEANHKRGSYTSAGKPRKSRRSIQRELYRTDSTQED